MIWFGRAMERKRHSVGQEGSSAASTPSTEHRQMESVSRVTGAGGIAELPSGCVRMTYQLGSRVVINRFGITARPTPISDVVEFSLENFPAMLRRPLRIFVVYVVAVVSGLTIIAHAQREIDEPVASEPQKSGESKSKLHEELFKKLFAQRRKDHIEAVQTLLKMDNYERLYKMITVLAEKVVQVIESSKSIIEKAGFLPYNSSFPEDVNVKDALSSILENTALFGDIILHLPDITHRILKTQRGWYYTIYWSLNFANQTRHLLNKSTITMFRLVEQELNITERDPSYFNPYRSAAHIGQREDVVKKKKSAKKEKRKKGPQIVKIEL